MTQLETLQQDLAALAERINAAVTQTKGDITLTRQQLEDFANAVQKQTIENVKDEIGGARIDMEQYVSLSIDYQNKIDVEVDCSSIVDEIIDEINDKDFDSEDVQRFLDGILEEA
jgi:uncharacterized protein with ATP-grasp and redox domains